MHREHPSESHLEYKSSLGKFKKTEIVSNMFSDYNTMRLEIDYRGKKKNYKEHKYMEAKQCILNNQESLKK